MKQLNLNELKKVNGSYWVPFYREKYSDKEFSRAGIYHKHNVCSRDQFFVCRNGKFEDIGRENAMITAFLKLERPEIVAQAGY